MSYKQKIEKGIIPPDKQKKYKKKTIYFAHPFDRIGTKREKMIEQILEERGFEVINPFKMEQELNKKYGVDNYFDNPCKGFAKDIVDQDWQMVSGADAYFGWFPKNATMIGTPIELVWAVLLEKEIITLAHRPHPFVLMFSHIIYIGYKNFAKNIPFLEQRHNYGLLTQLLLELLRKYGKNL